MMQVADETVKGTVAGVEHGAIEGHSIDFIPDNERTDRLSRQGPFWFLGNFTFFTMTIGFVGPSIGLSALWTTIAGTLGIMFGTLFMAFHGSQGPHLGLPQMIQSRAQFGYRGVIVVLLATLFVFAGFNIVNLVLMMQGLKALFNWDPVQGGAGRDLAGVHPGDSRPRLDASEFQMGVVSVAAALRTRHGGCADALGA